MDEENDKITKNYIKARVTTMERKIKKYVTEGHNKNQPKFP